MPFFRRQRLWSSNWSPKNEHNHCNVCTTSNACSLIGHMCTVDKSKHTRAICLPTMPLRVKSWSHSLLILSRRGWWHPRHRGLSRRAYSCARRRCAPMIDASTTCTESPLGGVCSRNAAARTISASGTVPRMARVHVRLPYHGHLGDTLLLRRSIIRSDPRRNHHPLQCRPLSQALAAARTVPLPLAIATRPGRRALLGEVPRASNRHHNRTMDHREVFGCW